MSRERPDRNSSPACEIAREVLLGELGVGFAHSNPVEFHCDACRAWFARARAHALALAALPRRGSELARLDGLVVAELNAGRRQERAASVLASLERLAVPSELESLLMEQGGDASAKAPHELERRVAFELAAGGSARIARQIGSVQQLSAPAELDALVAEALANGGRNVFSLRRVLAIAAALVVFIGAASVAHRFGWFQRERYEFTVVHVASTADLSPMARSTLSAVAGGLFDVPEVTR